jgi:hypothetical protein
MAAVPLKIPPRTDRLDSISCLFQPDQLELECSHAAEQLQHHLQRVPQHDQRLHSLIRQSNRDRTEYNIFLQYWACASHDLLLQSRSSGQCGTLTRIQPGERNHAVEFRRIRLPRHLQQRQSMEHRLPGRDHHPEHRHDRNHKLDSEVDVPRQPTNFRPVDWQLHAKRRGSYGQEFELQRYGSSGRKLRRTWLQRKFQWEQCAARKHFSKRDRLPLAPEAEADLNWNSVGA